MKRSKKHDRSSDALPLDDSERIRKRDKKLWEREEALAQREGWTKVFCPCRNCNGIHLLPLRVVRAHLLDSRVGRHPSFRLSSVQDEQDSSDEEWQAFETQEVQFQESSRQSLNRPESSQSRPESSQSFGNVRVQWVEKSTRFAEMLNEMHADDSAHDIPVDLARMRDYLGPDDEEFDPGVSERDIPNMTDPLNQKEELAKFKDHFQPLFEGSSQSVFEYTIHFVNLCSLQNMTNSGADAWLSFLRDDVLPKPNRVPESMYLCKKLIHALGFEFVNIDACPDGCVLYRKEFADLQQCPKCRKDRYVLRGKSRVPQHKVRYFPPIPRILRMFRCPTISALLTWAHENKSLDGLVRHVGDSLMWSFIDKEFDGFVDDERNLRLGVTLDGFCPYGAFNSTHSTWPIMLVNYNLPPWLMTKNFFIMLTILVPGPHSVKYQNLDTYLEPLIEDLEQLWLPGVDAYDYLGRRGSHKFQLRAMVMFTLSDYPALGYVSGLCVHGVKACAVCGLRGVGEQSTELGKVVHWGTRCWLPDDHVYRGRSYADCFDGHVETRSAPPRQSVEDIFHGAALKEEYRNAGGIHNRANDPYKVHGVYRKSIFYRLPYWPILPVRNCIDVMHLIKNVSCSILGYMFGVRDTAKVRHDLESRCIRPELWLDGQKKPHAPWNLSKRQQQKFLQTLHSVRVPSGHSSYWPSHVDFNPIHAKFPFRNMKSHDFHILMLQLIPLCLRGLMDAPVRKAIMSLSSVFQRLTVKLYDPSTYDKLIRDTIETMCQLEMYFPPSFFDVMTHLIMHVVEEMHFCGPVHTRWMYYVERHLSHLGSFVNNSNRSNPEGSIAARYIVQEALGYCTEYMSQYKTYTCRVWDSEEEEGDVGVVTEGLGQAYKLSDQENSSIHDYVLRTIDCLAPFRRQYETWVQSQDPVMPPRSFVDWLPSAMDEHFCNHPDAHWDLMLLSRPPTYEALSFRSVVAFGNHYRVLAEDSSHKTCDSGVGGYFDYSPNNDRANYASTYYVGEVTQILQLDYGDLQDPIVLFKAKWVRPNAPNRPPSYKIDTDHFLLANFKQLVGENDDPYVFPSLVHQLFFLSESERSGWRVVCRSPSRSERVFYDRSIVETDQPGSTLAVTDVPPHIADPDPDEMTLAADDEMYEAGIWRR